MAESGSATPSAGEVVLVISSRHASTGRADVQSAVRGVVAIAARGWRVLPIKSQDKIPITAQGVEADALAHLDTFELRDPRRQARFLVRQELFRLGLLKQEVNPFRRFDHGTMHPAVTQ